MIDRYTFVLLVFYVVMLVIVPLIFSALCRFLLPKRHWKKGALACTLLIYTIIGYGIFVGFEQLEVRQVEYASEDLPAAFDGYRIVQFSDAHVGTFEGRRLWMLQRMVDNINSQQADAIVFTGDLENMSSEDLNGKVEVLSQLKAPDGVYSILGNHDYAIYTDMDTVARQQDRAKTQHLERQMGWTLLMNEHRVIRRGGDSIVIAGMENWGKSERMPRLGDVRKTLSSPSPLLSSPFVIMLQHDPSCWREKILPECNAHLTLSGHTHGGQFSLLGWTPVSRVYDEWGGMYYEGSRAIHVSTGAGGLIPFRLAMPGEIVVITLKRIKK
ncbi:MAG: metallophosphoesterase [Prevotella sp.]|nr:metallophosphoesterase [Prevotella sp.]